MDCINFSKLVFAGCVGFCRFFVVEGFLYSFMDFRRGMFLFILCGATGLYTCRDGPYTGVWFTG